ncbi:MAG TPA: lysylphosphatidylglycerol synthase transmembrane domain-containing protein, partial [Polyangia bacterium]
VAASLYLVVLAGAGGIASIVIAARSHRRPRDDDDGPASTWREKLARHWRRFCAGAHHLGAPAPWLRGIGWALVGDAAGAVTVGLCARAIGVTLPLPAWYAAMLAARLVGVVPSTPGQIGVQEAAVAGALSLFGVDRGHAFAAALLHHAVHFVPVTLVGGIALWRRRAR